MKFSNRICSWYFKKELASIDELECIDGVIQTILSQFGVSLLILIIGFITGFGIQTSIYLISFISFRKFIEGYHAKEFWQCLIITSAIYASVIYLSILIPSSNLIFIGISMIFLVIVSRVVKLSISIIFVTLAILFNHWINIIFLTFDFVVVLYVLERRLTYGENE